MIRMLATFVSRVQTQTHLPFSIVRLPIFCITGAQSMFISIHFLVIFQSSSSLRPFVLSKILGQHNFQPITHLILLQETLVVLHKKLRFTMYKMAMEYTVNIIICPFHSFLSKNVSTTIAASFHSTPSLLLCFFAA